MGVGELVWTVGDLHLYSNHFEAAHKQLARLPSDRPLLKLDPSVEDLFAFKPEHIHLEGYVHQGKISAPVAV
jgi:thymidylate synthase